MKRKLITISDSASVSVPSETKMSIPEIAELFGIFYQTTKRHIRAIEKSGIASCDYSLPCTVEGKSIYPVYYGVNMIIALAFQVQSEKADVFRRWVIRRVTQSNMQIVFTSLSNKAMMN